MIKMGELVEESENTIRSELGEWYFSKIKSICDSGRAPNITSEEEITLKKTLSALRS
jgi:hypothetical protein